MKKTYFLSIILFIFGCGENYSVMDNNSNTINNNSVKFELNLRKKISLEDKIAGLYIFYFNRAPDWEGFNFWKNRGVKNNSSLKELSLSFSKHKVFISTYSDLDNSEFVKAIYRNLLGRDGDMGGIIYWTDELDKRVTRSEMVSNFVYASLSNDVTSKNFPLLSEEKLKEAQERQNLIINKVMVSLYFTNLFKEKCNIKNINNPEIDPAYKASIKILQRVTKDDKSVTDTKNYLLSIKDKDNPMDTINKFNSTVTTTTTVVSTSEILNYSITEAGIQEALDDSNYDYVISQLNGNRSAYGDLNDNKVKMNIAGAYVGKSGYTVFDITSAISGSSSSLNGFVSGITKDNNPVDTINNLKKADDYYSSVVNGLDCSNTDSLTEEQKSSCFNLGLVRLTSLSNDVKLLFGGDEQTIKKWADGVETNSTDDLNGNSVVDSSDASACAIVYASNPNNNCRDGSMATYRKRVTFTLSGVTYNTTLIDVDVGSSKLGYNTFNKLVTNKSSNNSAILTDGVCDINFNKTTNSIDGATYFPCPVINNGALMNISDSLAGASNVQSLFPTGSETRITIDSYIKNITGSKNGVIEQNNLSTYLQSH